MTSKFSNRYSVPSNEDYEPGSNNEILKNYLSIKTKEKMDDVEAQELKRTEDKVINNIDQYHRFTTEDICNIHELWLEDIYPFAGKYRTVAMSKNGFPFANPQLIEKLMTEFEKQYLSKYTPCNFVDINEFTFALGLIHVEFIIIHPFREGNGRIARLLADIMALQANKPPFNFESISQIVNPEGFKNYISAIQTSCKDNDYLPIQKIFKNLLENSI